MHYSLMRVVGTRGPSISAYAQELNVVLMLIRLTVGRRLAEEEEKNATITIPCIMDANNVHCGVTDTNETTKKNRTEQKQSATCGIKRK